MKKTSQQQSASAWLSTAGRYGLALLLVAGASLLRWWLPNLFGGAPYLIFYPAIFTAGVLGGCGPGILATLLAGVVVDVCFTPPIGEFVAWRDPVEFAHFIVFLFGGSAMSVVAGMIRSARDRERRLLVEQSKTNRTLAEQNEKLRESEQRLRGSFDNAALGIIEVDAEDRAIAVNDRLCEILGYQCEALIGKSVHELTYPEDRPNSDRLNAELHQGLHQRLDYEKRYLRSDGSPVWVHVVVSSIRDGAGRHSRSIGTVEDISRRKQAEDHIRQLNADLEKRNAALDAERARWRAVVEGIADEVWICDAQGRMTLMNLDTVTAMELQEFKDKSVQDILEQVEILNPDGHTRPPEQAPLLRSLRGEIVRGEEIMRHRRTGITRHRQFSSAPIRDETGTITGAVAIVRDITESKQLQRALETAKVAAEDANHVKDRFLAVMSHELRTPLTPVLAAVSMLQKRPHLDPRTLDMIRRNVELEARLIDDLLDLTSIARGRIELNKRPLELRSVIERAIEVSRPDIDARRVNFGVDFGPGSYLVQADLGRLQHVFWNLLRNAIKFTPHGGCIGVRCREGEGEVTVEVIDSGIGIEPEALGRVFNAFAQADPAMTRHFGGAGLGLAISKTIVELHGGTIEAISPGSGKGAKFRVRLPLAPAAIRRLSPRLQEEGVPARSGPSVKPPSPRVLLVEDHGDTLEMLRRTLESHGYEVTTAGDVATALEVASGASFDMLISDLGLPDGTGLDLMRELRNRGRELLGIAVSGYGQDCDLRLSREAGFAAHIVKPVDMDRLLSVLTEVAGGGRRVSHLWHHVYAITLKP